MRNPEKKYKGSDNVWRRKKGKPSVSFYVHVIRFWGIENIDSTRLSCISCRTWASGNDVNSFPPIWILIENIHFGKNFFSFSYAASGKGLYAIYHAFLLDFRNINVKRRGIFREIGNVAEFIRYFAGRVHCWDATSKREEILGRSIFRKIEIDFPKFCRSM